MLRVAAGDEAGFNFLVEKYHRAMIHFLFRMVRNQAVAEELAQEVFLRVYRSRESYRAEAKFTTWLYRIATNLAVNHARDTKHERSAQTIYLDAPDEETGTTPDVADDEPTVEQRLLRDERMAAIRTHVMALPERQRMAVLMHKYQGMDYRQIGEVLKLSESATKSLLFRAYQTLRDKLKDFVVSDERAGRHRRGVRGNRWKPMKRRIAPGWKRSWQTCCSIRALRLPRFAMHVERCERCRSELDELRATMALLDTWESPGAEPLFSDPAGCAHAGRARRPSRPAGLPVCAPALPTDRRMHVRPLAAMALTVVLLVGGGAYLGISNWEQPAAPPGQAAVVHDLQTMDNNAQLLDQLEAMSNAPTAATDLANDRDG